MGSAGKIPFSWPVWICVATLAGFLSALPVIFVVFSASTWESVPSFDRVLDRQAVFLILSTILSLPALAHRILMRQSGIDARFYYLATVLGGWVMMGGVAEGLILVADSSNRVPIIDMSDEDVILLGGALVGCMLTAGLQSLALPRSIQFFYWWTATVGAAAGMAVAVGVAVGLLALRGDRIFWILAFAIGVGWATIAGATGWPVRKAIRDLARGRAPS